MLLQQLAASHRLATDRFYRTLYESLLDPRLLTSSKQAMYLNVLFRSLRADLNLKRVKAFVKRLLQLTALHQPPFACGALYLIKELEETFPGLHSLIDQPESYFDGDEENFQDVPEEAEAGSNENEGSITSKRQIPEENPQRSRYDGRKRDPDHCNADRSCLWELVCIFTHPNMGSQLTKLLRSHLWYTITRRSNYSLRVFYSTRRSHPNQIFRCIVSFTSWTVLFTKTQSPLRPSVAPRLCSRFTGLKRQAWC